VGCETCWERIV